MVRQEDCFRRRLLKEHTLLDPENGFSHQTVPGFLFSHSLPMASLQRTLSENLTVPCTDTRHTRFLSIYHNLIFSLTYFPNSLFPLTKSVKCTSLSCLVLSYFVFSILFRVSFILCNSLSLSPAKRSSSFAYTA